LGGFAVGLCVFAKQTEDFCGTYKEKKFFVLFFLGFSFFKQLVIFFYYLYFLPKEILILIHIFLGGLRVRHRVFAKQTQELFGSKKEIGILVSLFLGFLCLFLVFPKEKIRIFCWQEIGILFHFSWVFGNFLFLVPKKSQDLW
jgi:hypothetical protein